MARFKYKTGKEITENRHELKKTLDDSDYNCEKNIIISQINCLWENSDVENALIKNKVADIRAVGINGSDLINILDNPMVWEEYKHLMNLEKLIRRKCETRKIQTGRYSLFGITGLRPGFPPASKDKGFEIIQYAMSLFGINNISIFNELMEEYGFEWDIALNVTKTSPFPMDFSLLDDCFLLLIYPFTRKMYIQYYDWILKIGLKEQEK